MQHTPTEMDTDKEVHPKDPQRVCKTSQIVTYHFPEYAQKHNAVTDYFPRNIKAE